MSAHRGASLGEVISKLADCSGLTAQIAAEPTLETLSGKAIKVKGSFFFFFDQYFYAGKRNFMLV